MNDLPLRPFTAALPSPVMAVMLTGESGWVGIDRDITQTMLDHGIPVVGFDMPAYLKTRRSPDQIGADLERVGESMPTLSEAAHLNGLGVVCVYGSKESKTLCPEMPPAIGSIIVTDGGHHLDKDYAMLTDLLLEHASH